MNWTGGKLQRLKAGRNNSVVHRQKEHFARVRTHLQNGTSPGSSAPPFRPSYLGDDDLNLGGDLPRFSSGSVRHVDHSSRGRNREESHAPDVERGQGPKIHHAAEAKSSRRAHCYESASPARSEKPKRKHKAADANFDDDSLEAKRRRLLQKQDWVGLAPSRPVNMHFSSNREKDRIGRRRKVAGKPAADRMGSEKPSRHVLHHTDGHHPRPHMTGALKRDVDNIRIRIGTDALTTQTSMHQYDHAQSPAAPASPCQSSDSMLFDNEDLYTAPGQPMQHARSASPFYNVHVGVSKQNHVVPAQLPFSREPSLGRKSPSYAPRDRSKSRDHSSHQTHGEDRSFQITHRVGGVECPLRLVFDQPSEHVHVGGSDSPANAGLYAFGHAHSDQGNPHGSSTSFSADKARSLSIVDDRPWNKFLAIPEGSSSRSTISAWPRGDLSIPSQLSSGEKVSEAACSIGSQHATLGDQTRMSSSSFISASLPCLTPGRRRVQRKPRNQSQDGNREKKSEKLWQSFVQVGSNNLASDTLRLESSVEGKPSESGSLRIWSSSLAVVSHPSDDVQRAATRTLTSPSGYMAVTSPEIAEEYTQDEVEFEDMAGEPLASSHGILSEEQSVTHVSIANDVSHDTSLTQSRNGLSQASLTNNVSHNTLTSGILSELSVTHASIVNNASQRNPSRIRGSHFGPALARRSEPVQASESRPHEHSRSIYDIPVSNHSEQASDEDKGMDLVDAYRMW